MADVQPLTALHYDLARTGGLEAVAAPPYDVIDPDEREALAARSPHNVVEIDLPAGAGRRRSLRARRGGARRPGGARARSCATTSPRCGRSSRTTPGPTAHERTRRGLLARVRVEDYGPGRIRPARAHPPRPQGGSAAAHARDEREPVADLLALRRPRRRGLGRARTPSQRAALGRADRRGRHAPPPLARRGPGAAGAVTAALADRELLIADGHHRYETARAYADEIGGEGDHRYVLMCLVALQDPGLTVFPTHRLLSGLDDGRAHGAARRRHPRLGGRRGGARRPRADGRAGRRPGSPSATSTPATSGRCGSRCATRRSPTRRCRSMPEPYRRLDTAVLEALVLKGALGMTEDDISHLHGLEYARSTSQARERRARRRRPGRVLHARHAGRAGPRRRGDRPEHAAEDDLLLPQGPDRACCSTRWAETVLGLERCHEGHRPPPEPQVRARPARRASTGCSRTSRSTNGGEDMGPTPQELLAASLASCTAITIEMYAKRKGWNVDGLEVDVEYGRAERGCPTDLRARPQGARLASARSRSRSCR